MVKPAPYTAIEGAAIPLARRLSEALKEPQPDRNPAPVDWDGLYTFRQEMRMPDTPFVQPVEIARDRRSMAIYLMVDRCERLQAIAVIRDSCPASHWKETGFEVGDWDLSQGHVQSLKKRGSPVMLVSFLGNTCDHSL